MQFKHPELLYALFLLLIPILVHLFQLRKFQKTPFTNVKFLKEVTLQTRKSSQLKKWLVLACRLLALAFIILAFAQPFIANKTALTVEKETVIYLDNSFSMQAKGSRGELLQRAKQQLFEDANLPEKLSWFTNNSVSKEITESEFKAEILQTPYSSSQLSLNEILLQAENLFSKRDTEKNLILISDFQGQTAFPDVSEKAINIQTVQPEPVNTNNISIDSVYISNISPSITELTVTLSNYGSAVENVPVSLFNEDVLTAKTSASFESTNTASVLFEIESGQPFDGRLNITDQNLIFDNDLYFNINEKKKIKVLSINEKDDTFLRRIYTNDEFDYASQNSSQPDYNSITEQNLVVLNELKDIPESLQAALQSFTENGGNLLVIPSTDIEPASYSRFLQLLRFGVFADRKSVSEKQVTTIHFSHPVYRDVFENEVTNFQYPKVNSHYSVSGNYETLLSFQDNSPFLAQNSTIYVFTASLEQENSNFKGSPLIVPTFYNIAKKSLDIPKLYYTIGVQNTYDISVSLHQDRILSLSNGNSQFIPLQQNTANKVSITTNEEPADAGIYTILNDKEIVEKVTYNYSRAESNPSYLNASEWKNTQTYNSIHSLFEKAAQDNTITDFWKLCIIFALFFLLMEMLILKLIK